MTAEELESISKIKINVDEKVYNYDHLVEIRDETIQECDSCLSRGKLWFTDEDPVVGLCDACLIKAYGIENIEAC